MFCVGEHPASSARPHADRPTRSTARSPSPQQWSLPSFS